VLQDILAFSDQAVGKTGEGHGQNSALKDGSDQEGLNAPNRRLIQDQGDRAAGLDSQNQRHMERDQHFRSQAGVSQETVQPLLSSLGTGLQG
jgi:hypothetical protein